MVCQCIKSKCKVFSCNTAQSDCFQFCTGYCNCRSGHHTFVQMYQLRFVVCFHFCNTIYLHGNLDDQTAQRDHNDCCTNVKCCMDRRDLSHCDNTFTQRRVCFGKYNQCDQGEQDRTCNVEQQVHCTYAFRIFACAYGRHNCCYTSTDILTHDDEYCSLCRNQTSSSQGQQDTLRSRGRLDDRCYTSTGQNTHQRICTHGNECCSECFRFSQRFYCIRHCAHTDEQDTETDHDPCNIFAFCFFTNQSDDNTGHNCQRCQSGRAQEFCPFCRGYQPASDCCTDIRTHDDTDRLCQVHQACVYKTNDHYCCCRRRLDDRCYQSTQQDTHQFVLCQNFQNFLHFRACRILQTICHNVHTINEHCKAADKGDYHRTHILPPILPFYFFFYFLCHY